MKKLINNFLILLLVCSGAAFGANDSFLCFADADTTGVHPAAVKGPHIDLRDFPGFIEDVNYKPATFFPPRTRDFVQRLKKDIRRWPVVNRNMFYALCGLKPSDFGLVQKLRTTDPILFIEKVRPFVVTVQADERVLLSFLMDSQSSSLLRQLCFTCIKAPGTILLEDNPDYVPPFRSKPMPEAAPLKTIAQGYDAMSEAEREEFETRRRRLDLRGLTFKGTPLSLFFRLLMKGQHARIEAAKAGYAAIEMRLTEAGFPRMANLFKPKKNLGTATVVLLGDEEGEMVLHTIESRAVFSSGSLPIDCPGTTLNTGIRGLACLTAEELPEPVCCSGSFFPGEALAAVSEARRFLDAEEAAECSASASVDGHTEEVTTERDRFKALQDFFHQKAGECSYEHSPAAMDAYFANGGARGFKALTSRGHSRFHSHSEQLMPEYFKRVMVPEMQAELAQRPRFNLRRVVLCLYTDRDPCPACIARTQHVCSKHRLTHVVGAGTVDTYSMAGIITGYRGFNAQIRVQKAAEPKFAYRDSRHPSVALEFEEADLAEDVTFAMVNGTADGNPV